MNVLHSVSMRQATGVGCGAQAGHEGLGGPVGEITTSNDELRTVRDAMRELNRMVDALNRGEEHKFVLTHRNRMRAVVVSVETFSSMQRKLAALPEG